MEYVGEFGHTHEWPVEFDLHDPALTVSMTVRRPDGSWFARTYDPAELGAMPQNAFQYVVQQGDLTVAGKYSVLLEFLWAPGGAPTRREYVVQEFSVASRPPTADEAVAATSVITSEFVRSRFLSGLPLSGPNGEPLTDETIQQRIDAVVAAFERRYEVKLRPTRIKVGRERLEGELPEHDLFFPGLDYHPDGNLENRYHIMALPIAPIRQLHAFGLWLPGMTKAARFPLDWAFVTPRSSKVRIYPGRTLSLALPAMSGFFVNVVGMGRVVPQAWHFSYTAGYSAQDLLTTEADVLNAIGKMAAIEVLVPGSIDKALAEGIQSVSISADGLSQSVNLLQNPNALKYQALINQYAKDLEAWERTYWARKSGVRWGMI